MPFDASRSPQAAPKKIAIVGSGISGLSAAWLLSSRHDVVLYEREARLGGHSNTVDVETSAGAIPVDTGFIVFNEPSYPNFTALLDHIGVAPAESCMSFGVSMNGGRVEYSGQTFSSVFARRANVASPTFWKMLTDIPKFHRDARETLRVGFCEHASLGEYVAHRGYGRGFREHFLKPMAAAIWSTPQMKIFDYPAFAFLRFFENHGLLQVLNLPEWRTVAGGSRAYVRKLAEKISGEVRTSAGAERIERIDGKVRVTDATGHVDLFDEVIIASHADAARAMIRDLDAQERDILSAFQYQENRAVLHFDERHMPKRRRAWSSWNYIGDDNDGAVSYWMNRLQNLPCEEDIFVTLNPVGEVDPDKLIAAFNYDHPMFNAATERAQAEIWNIQGRGGLWYAGAHLGHGFHEDGIQAGLAAAEAAGGVQRPWTVKNASSRLKLPQSSAAAPETTL
ncbi:MAG: FAD-dependent oxidoreductase [Pseudomonadota bacterium]